jgi:predicted DNA-binding transcriptional regulator AlpA
MEESLMDLNQLARELKIAAKTIRNKLSDGTWPIPPLRIGRLLRWRREDVARDLTRLRLKTKVAKDPSSKRKARRN